MSKPTEDVSLERRDREDSHSIVPTVGGGLSYADYCKAASYAFGMLYRLREAIARQAPDVIAKAIAEVGAKILTGGGG